MATGRITNPGSTDQGTEFFNQLFRALMKEEDIQLYKMYNETNASILKHLIRTLKSWHYITAKETMRYMDMLADLGHSYNHSVNCSMKKPADLTVENEKQV